MTLTYDILNEGGEAQDEFIMEECSGNGPDHSDRVLELLREEHGAAADHDCEGGHWVTIADGKIIMEGEFHPFRIHYQAD